MYNKFVPKDLKDSVRADAKELETVVPASSARGACQTAECGKDLSKMFHCEKISHPETSISSSERAGRVAMFHHKTGR